MLPAPALETIDRDLAFALATGRVDLDSPDLCIRALHDAGFRVSAYRDALLNDRWDQITAEAKRLRVDLDVRRSVERAAGFPSLAELSAAALMLVAAYGWAVVLGMRDLV